MIAFISDIHGNLPALQSVLREIDVLGCEKVICLGDVVGYYTQINECIEVLRERNIHSLLGNHDYYMVTNTCCESRTVRLCLDYQRTVISDQNLRWLKNNEPLLDTKDYSIRHGGWHDPVEERFSEFDFSWVASMPQQVYLSGHSHKQTKAFSESGNIVYCNPGAVGQPRDNDPRAAFAVWHGGTEITLHRVEYDIGMVVCHMKKAGLGDWIWKCLYTGRQIGK